MYVYKVVHCYFLHFCVYVILFIAVNLIRRIKTNIFIYIYLFILTILCEYMSSKKLLDSYLESSTLVTRHSSKV